MTGLQPACEAEQFPR